MPLTPISAVNLHHRRVLIRQDLNAPIRNNRITSTRRIDAALGTIRAALTAGAGVMLMSHRGRPTTPHHDPALSLAPIAACLSQALGQKVPLSTDYLTHPPPLAPGKVLLLENVRFNPGETTNDDTLARRYAALADVFIMDAFGTAHRAHASTCGVIRHAPIAAAGPLLLAELSALHAALDQPRPPLVAIVGGAKVSTKLTVLTALSSQVQQLIPGGGIANTFLAAAGVNIGKSLVEPALIPAAQALLQATKASGNPIPLPQDVIVAQTPADAVTPATPATIKPTHQLADDDRIFDIGPATARHYASLMQTAGTILWNGPLGLFEHPQFATGTQLVAQAIAQSNAYSIAGGGDTLAATELFNLTQQISHLSTGGGAFLELLQGNPLPAVAALEART